MSELIAEARVLVVPDTTTFRALLTSQVTAATSGPPIPVAVTPVVNTSSAAAASAGAAAAQARAAAIKQTSVAATAAAVALDRLAKAQDILAVAERRAIASTTEVGAAQTRYAATIRATTTTFSAYEAALQSTDFLLIKQTRDAFAAAKANEALALATLQAAKAEQTRSAALARGASAQAAQLGQLSKGAASAALSFVGLRGATLAAGGAFLTGAAAIVAFGKSLQTAAQLQTSLNVFAATTDATATQMERIRDVSIELGQDLTLPGVSANSAADALSGLARAGLSVESAIAGARGTLQLATAAAIDNETAVTLVANALNAFQLSGRNATRVADLLAASSKESQGSIVDVGLAFQQAAAAAAQAGVTVEDTIALLTQLGRAGLRGSDAGTSLRVALLRLIAPSKEARAALEGLGVAIRDEQGNVRPEVFAEITGQLSRLTKAQRDATLAMIFGQDAFRAAAILGRDGARGLAEMRDATQEQGVAAELAAARTQGLSGSIENLKNQFQDLGRSIGEGAAGPIGDLVDIFAGGIQNINAFIGFLDGIGDATPRAEQSISQLADEFERLNREAGGGGTRADAVNRVNELGAAGSRAVLDFADLVEEAGKMNRAFSEREGITLVNDEFREFRQVTTDAGTAGEGLRDEVEGLNQALEDSQPAALKARDGIEAFRSSITQAARDTQAAINAIQPPEGFLLPTPQFTQAPLEAGARTEGALQLAQAQGDLDEVLRLQRIVQAKARQAFAESKGDSEERTRLFNEMRTAEAAVISTQRQIAEQRKSAQQKAISDAEQEAREAQQEFLARQAAARAQAQNRIAIADQTKGLQDNINAQRAFGALVARQIAAIRESALSERQKTDAINALRAAAIATNGALKELDRTKREQRAEQQRQAQEERTENLALRTQIAEARGNDNAVITAINAQITDAKKTQASAKRGTQEWLKATLALEQLREKRRELLEKAREDDDAVGGTSLADLFQRAEQIASGAGNVGGLNSFNVRAQPRIQQEVQARLDIVNDPAAARQAQQERSTQNLIQAIDRLTLAITGNAASGTPVTRREQNQWRNLTQEQRFFNQRTAKQMVEQGLMG